MPSIMYESTIPFDLSQNLFWSMYISCINYHKLYFLDTYKQYI